MLSHHFLRTAANFLDCTRPIARIDDNYRHCVGYAVSLDLPLDCSRLMDLIRIKRVCLPVSRQMIAMSANESVVSVVLITNIKVHFVRSQQSCAYTLSPFASLKKKRAG